MKIPRFSSGPLCYSLEGWSTRMGISDLTLGICLAIIFFYLSATLDLNEEYYDKQVRDVTTAILISFGVLFCIIAFFASILLLGLYNRNKKLLLIWCYYLMVVTILLFIFLILTSIGSFIINNVVPGLVILLVAFIATGHLIYSGLIVYSIYLNIKDEERNHTSFGER